LWSPAAPAMAAGRGVRGAGAAAWRSGRAERRRVTPAARPPSLWAAGPLGYNLAPPAPGRWPRAVITFGVWRSLASALDWGSRGRRFKSCHPDHSPAVSLEPAGAVGSLAPMLNTSARRALLPLVATLGLAAAACESTAVEPDYSQMLPPGSPALLPLGPNEPRPDFTKEWTQRERILPALDRSIEWTKKASSARFFPIAGIDHDRALASLEHFREILTTATSAEDFDTRLGHDFPVYKSAGWDGRGGGVLFTGYCTPILDGSTQRSDIYKYPLYGLPPDLAKDKDGGILGRKGADGGVTPYPDRKTIDGTGL